MSRFVTVQALNSVESLKKWLIVPESSSFLPFQLLMCVS